MHLAILLSLAAATTTHAGPNGHTFITIGAPGNPAYQLPPDRLNPLTERVNGRGSVDYAFKIARTEISVGQYVDFINLFTPGSEQLTDLLEPTNTSLARSTFLPVGERYVVAGDLRDTQVGLETPQILMYLNWLHNGRTNSVADILDGAYNVGSIGADGSITLNAEAERRDGARFWIPTLDEYLKAAHFDPDKNGNGPGWWDYAHSSDEPPVFGLPGAADVARGLTNDQVRELTMGQSVSFGSLPLELYPDAASPWGVLDLLGGREELIDDRAVSGVAFRPFLSKFSYDTSLTFIDGDRIDDFSTAAFQTSQLNLHIVTLVPTPPLTAPTCIALSLLNPRRRR